MAINLEAYLPFLSAKMTWMTYTPAYPELQESESEFKVDKELRKP